MTRSLFGNVLLVAVGVAIGAGGYALYRGDLARAPVVEPSSAPSESAQESQPSGGPATSTRQVSAPPPKARPAVSQSLLIEPGVRLGKILATTSEQELRKVYGASNVEPGDIYLGEGETQPGTILFKGDKKRELRILWFDEGERRLPNRIEVIGTAWHTKEGVRLGTTLARLAELNDGPFTLAGFGWDYGGTVTSWRGGLLESRLTRKGRVLLRLQPVGGAYDAALVGDSLFPSSNKQMARLNPAVAQMLVEFPSPTAAQIKEGEAGDAAADLPGRWRSQVGAGTMLIDLRSDGSFVFELNNYPLNLVSTSGRAAGRWWVRKGRFEGSVEASNLWSHRVGATWSDQILLLTDAEWVLRNEQGTVEAYTRE